MHASMQKTFLNPEDGDFAMIAYIDYNKGLYQGMEFPGGVIYFRRVKEGCGFLYRQTDEDKRRQEWQKKQQSRNRSVM